MDDSESGCDRTKPRFQETRFFKFARLLSLGSMCALAMIALSGTPQAAPANAPDAVFAKNYFAPTAPLNWLNAASDKAPKFYYPNPMRPYMRRLKETYHILDLTAGARSDFGRISLVCDWVHQQWRHKGDCQTQKNDPIAILEAAHNGSEFSCYEYSLVAAGCLNSIGIKTRVVVLLPRDIERRPPGHYHVVAEAFMNDRKKWVMVDPQWNAIPTMNNYPLSIIELQNGLSRMMGGIEFGNLAEEMRNLYPRDLVIYAHFLYTPIDNRVIGAKSPEINSGGIMLVPAGEYPPRSFGSAPVGRFISTSNVSEFYVQPQP